MADYFCQGSCFVEVPKDKIERSKEIIERIEKELEETDEQYAGFDVEVEKTGVWIYHGEYISPDSAEILIRALVEELDLIGIYTCSWAYSCSKLRIGEFGGGAFAIKKGYETIWIDALYEVERLAKLLQLEDSIEVDDEV